MYGYNIVDYLMILLQFESLSKCDLDLCTNKHKVMKECFFKLKC